MKAWLNDEEPQEQETEDIWGVLQSSYTIKDMHAWVNNGGTLQKKRKHMLKHCAYEKCTQDLKNARGGAFCNVLKY
jgi:hypothetical protein